MGGGKEETRVAYTGVGEAATCKVYGAAKSRLHYLLRKKRGRHQFHLPTIRGVFGLGGGKI